MKHINELDADKTTLIKHLTITPTAQVTRFKAGLNKFYYTDQNFTHQTFYKSHKNYRSITRDQVTNTGKCYQCTGFFFFFPFLPIFSCGYKWSRHNWGMAVLLVLLLWLWFIALWYYWWCGCVNCSNDSPTSLSRISFFSPCWVRKHLCIICYSHTSLHRPHYLKKVCCCLSH